MSYDKFTATACVNALKSGANPERIWDAVKGLNNQGGPSDEAIEWFKANEGKRVKVKTTGYIGTVEKLNTSNGGFYPGSRYPIYVRIDGHAGLLEYDFKWLKVIE